MAELLRLPAEVNSTNYKLLPGKMFHTSRRGNQVLGIELHITAGLQDINPDLKDESAEGTIRWALNSGVEASWHAIADTDDVEICLPDWYTAFHAKGYNSTTVGLEISKLDVNWSKMPSWWVERTLRNAAKYCAAIVDKHDLPLTLSTKAQVDAAIAANRKFGFTYHMWTSPTTRSDPGRDFPWAQFIGYVKDALAGREYDVALSDAEVERIAKRTRDLILWEPVFPEQAGKSLGGSSVRNNLGYAAMNAVEATKLLRAIADKFDVKDVDEAALAAALSPLIVETVERVIKTSPGLDPAQVAQAVAAEFGSKLSQ